jgi:hypothetical protein
MVRKVVVGVLLGVLYLLLTVFFIRLFSDRQLDDLSPGIPCDEELIRSSDVLYVIPAFDGKNISSDLEWCKYVLSFEKELAMHGVFHTYNEFGEYRNETYVFDGSSIFEDCFGYSPERFKPPQVAWTRENNWMMGYFDVDLDFNQVFHKAYHCNDTGMLPNWFQKAF